MASRKANKVLEDVARIAGGTASAFGGLSRQIKEEIRSHIDELALRLDLVPREDFERLEAIVIELRKEQEALKSELAGKKKTTKASKTKKASSS